MDSRVKEIKDRLAKAYPAYEEWRFDPSGRRDSRRENEVFWNMRDGSHCGKVCDVIDANNGPIIAHATSDLRYLPDRVKVLEDCLRAAETALIVFSPERTDAVLAKILSVLRAQDLTTDALLEKAAKEGS